MEVGSRTAERRVEVERATWIVRWFAIPFGLAQTFLFEPTAEGVEPSVDLVLAGFVMAGVLVVAQVLSWRVLRHGPDAGPWPGRGALTLDTVVAAAIPVVYGFDHMSTFWPIMTFPIIEGAMRAGMIGALLVWGVSSTTYVANLIRILETRPNPDSWIPGMSWAAGILLMVALGTGFLGRRVLESDRAIDEWQRRHLDLTSRTDGLALLPSSEAMWAEAEALARRMVAGVRVASLRPDEEPTQDWIDGEATHFPVRTDGELLGTLVVDVPVGSLDAADQQLLDLLVRHLASAVAVHGATVLARERAHELEASAVAQSRFLADLSHELKTPLTVITGNAGLLDQFDQFPEQSRERIRRMLVDNAERLRRLLIDATEAITHDAAELPVSPRPVEVAPLVESVAGSDVVTSPRHHSSIVVAPDVPMAMADPERVVQILLNLQGNAIRYSPDGGDVVTTIHHDGDWVYVDVADEGVGIAPDRLPRLFGRMARLHPELDVDGTGLGLHLSRQLARAMGGDVVLVTTSSSGSTFRLQLPRGDTPGGTDEDGSRTNGALMDVVAGPDAAPAH